MRALTHKLGRELWAMRTQAAAIALVIAGGVAVYVMSLSTLDSLLASRDGYYRDYRFADVFAELERAPARLLRRIAALPGVDQVSGRIVAGVKLRVADFADPVLGTMVSLPEERLRALNGVHLRLGHLPVAGRDDQVLLSESFAAAHQLAPGARLEVTLDGRRRRFTVTGLALSPEYVYQIAPGAAVPDFRRYAILWADPSVLESARDMRGAFNSLALTLTAGAAVEETLTRLDLLLSRYGGRGAYPRRDQLSHRFLSEELKQLRTLATVFPVIFFGVSTFLLNIVVTRLIGLQREAIATLKAFGYGNFSVGLHYASLVLVVVAAGVGAGIGAGVWLGRGLSAVYADFYRFPALLFRLRGEVIAGAAVISTAVALAGTWRAIRAAAALPPAQAMRPEPPASYRPTLIERTGLQRWLAQPTRMIARHLERRPVKSALSVLGIACACGIMMVGKFQEDAIDFMLTVHYGMSQRQDLTLTFTAPTSVRALYSLRALPGVEQVEGARSVAVRLRAGHRSYRGQIQGLEPEGRLHRLLDRDLRRVPLPPRGLVLSDYLAARLGVRPGDVVAVEVLEGGRARVPLAVAAVTRQFLGMSAYMQRQALNRVLGEADALSHAYLRIDAEQRQPLYERLDNMPAVLGTRVRASELAAFRAILADTVLFFTFVATLLGAVIAFGVVYNLARIGLAERARELASLRVLGFTRAEVAYVLLGELAVLTLLALPLGFALGQALCGYLALNLQSDLYRVPLVLEPDTYAFAALVVLASAGLCGYLVWRQLARLDLVAALKTKE